MGEIDDVDRLAGAGIPRRIRQWMLVLVLCAVPQAYAQESYIVSAWNLGHFHEGAKRGFPAGTIRARRTPDYQFIASAIKQLDAKILVLSEINGEFVEQMDEDSSYEEV